MIQAKSEVRKRSRRRKRKATLPPQDSSDGDEASLSAAGGILLALLSRRARSWPELVEAGFNAENLLPAIAELERAGYVVQVSPELVNMIMEVKK
jgi:hypothetical protein